jgi:protein CpxP
MTKFKKVLFGVLGVYIFAVLSLAQAQDAPGTSGPSEKWHPGQRIQEIYNQLNLTDEQKKQLEANKQQHRAQMENARQAIKADKEALRAELMKPQLDMPKVTAIHEEIKALQDKMEDVKLNSILAVRAILTPDQYLKFTSLMQKHKQEQAGK